MFANLHCTVYELDEAPKVGNNIQVNKSRCFRIPIDVKVRLPSRNCKRNGISIWSKRNMVNHGI